MGLDSYLGTSKLHKPEKLITIEDIAILITTVSGICWLHSPLNPQDEYFARLHLTTL